jgi:hypothetical protein
MIRPLRAGYVACAVGARTRAAIRAAAPVIASDLSFIFGSSQSRLEGGRDASRVTALSRGGDLRSGIAPTASWLVRYAGYSNGGRYRLMSSVRPAPAASRVSDSPFSSSRSGTVPAHDLMASQRIRKNGATFPGWTHRCRSMNRRTGRCQFREIYWAEKPSDLRYTAFDRAGNRFVLDDLRLALDR